MFQTRFSQAEEPIARRLGWSGARLVEWSTGRSTARLVVAYTVAVVNYAQLIRQTNATGDVLYSLLFSFFALVFCGANSLPKKIRYARLRLPRKKKIIIINGKKERRLLPTNSLEEQTSRV